MENLSENKKHKMYLDWCNNFLSIKGFADYYDISQKSAYKIIELGRIIHNQRVKELIY